MGAVSEGGARDAIFSAIRRGLGVGGTEQASRRRAVDERLAAHRRNLVPKRGQLPHGEQVALFHAMAVAANATVEELASTEELPARIADYLRQQNLPSRLTHGSDALLVDLPWATAAPSLSLRTGRADADDEVSLSHAMAGVAESGTLVLLSGPDNPTTLNFLPETHIVVLRADAIVGSYEDVFDRLRERYGAGVMPRTLNMITGPSRTADIEQRIELGAHGPRRLHIFIVDNQTSTKVGS